MAKELITLQFGHYSNFVGSHWWNFQVLQRERRCAATSEFEIDSKCMLKESAATPAVGGGVKGSIVVPRLVSVHLKGCGGHPITTDSEIVEKEDEVKTWQGETKTYDKTKTNSGDSAIGSNLDDDWSSFLLTKLHSKSVLTVPGHFQGDSFESYSSGLDAFKADSFSGEIEDSLRFFAEECDYLQGFQLLCDLHDGFAGLATSTVELIKDEFPKRSILAVGFPKAYDFPKDVLCIQRQVLTYLMAVHGLTAQECLVIPVSLLDKCWMKSGLPRSSPLINLNVFQPFESSAFIASALETMSSCYRTVRPLTSLTEVINSVSERGRQMGSLKLSVPLPAFDAATFRKLLLSHSSFNTAPFLVPLTPHVNCQHLPYTQHIAVRGIHPIHSATRELDQYLERNYSLTSSFSCALQPGLITTNGIDYHPLNWSQDFKKNGKGKGGVSAMTILQSSPDISNALTSLVSESRRVKASKFSHIFDADLLAESQESLLQLSHRYQPPVANEGMD
eukprot:m.63154 g.63154  ORF g.63154 m.63154 type:complete len:505 (+) comp35146_c0_seq4:50-1564(+)